MSSLGDFKKRVETELLRGDQPNPPPAEAGEFMAKISQRHRQFDRISDTLMKDAVQPRLQAMIAFFENAKLMHSNDPLRCKCWFGYSLRCAASIRLEFACGHDDLIENLILSCELEILPAFIKYDRHDRMIIRLDAVDQEAVAIWVEDKLLDFVGTYHRLERANRDLSEVLVTDPVCGMRINRTEAAASMEHQGHPFYFCAAACRDRFAENPKRYMSIADY